MNDVAMLVLAIIGGVITYTAGVVAICMYISAGFRKLEKTFYREMDKHRAEDDRQFDFHKRQIQRLELKVFGFTPVVWEGPGTNADQS